MLTALLILAAVIVVLAIVGSVIVLTSEDSGSLNRLVVAYNFPSLFPLLGELLAAIVSGILES